MKNSDVINCVEEALKLRFVVRDEFSDNKLTKRLVALMKTAARRNGWKLTKILVTKEYKLDPVEYGEYCRIFGINIENALYSINDEVKEYIVNMNNDLIFGEKNFVLGTGEILYSDAQKMPFILGVL